MSQAEQFLQSWLSHRAALEALVEKVNDEQLGFKPWDGAMSFGELTVHIVGAMEWFSKSAKTLNMERPERAGAATPDTVQGLLSAVRSATERTTEVIRTLSDEDLAQMVDAKQIFGRDMPAMVLLMSGRDHEIHHKGQLFVYARLLGLQELPFFVNTKR